MKKIFFLSVLAVASLLVACQKDKDQLTDDDLIQQLLTSSNKTPIAVADLPEAIKEYVEENHFETYIEHCYSIARRGYEVVLGDENISYFDERGRPLRSQRNLVHNGPCGRGQAVRPSSLPSAITDYIAENYPDAEIQRAKKLGSGPYFVKIDEPNYILIFDSNGTFIEATVLFYKCRPLGTPIDIEDLPASVTGYIADNLPGAEIKVAFQKTNGMYVVGITTDLGRRAIVVFDADGNFLFVRP